MRSSVPNDANEGKPVNGMNSMNGMSSMSSMSSMNDMLDCTSVMRQLWDYLDRQLTPETMQAIHRHLDDCQRCRPQAEFRQAFERAVAGARVEAGDTDALRERIRLALRKADSSIG